MAPTVPTVAYVGYKDGHKAIVAVSLIKNYAPSSLTDLQKDKDAYWRSRGSEDEGFYPADVLELGVTQTDLVKRLAKRRIPVPDSIFEDGVSATEVMKKAVSAKDAAAKVRAANKKKNAATETAQHLLLLRRRQRGAQGSFTGRTAQKFSSQTQAHHTTARIPRAAGALQQPAGQTWQIGVRPFAQARGICQLPGNPSCSTWRV